MVDQLEEVAVVRIGAEWRVVTRAQRSGPYAYRVDAEEAALQLCRKVRTNGGAARLLVQDPTGELLTWPIQ